MFAGAFDSVPRLQKPEFSLSCGVGLPFCFMWHRSFFVLVFVLVFHFAPSYGHTNVLVFTGVCSLMGSLSVMSVKALVTSIKLTFEGMNQLVYPETWFFMLVVATCVITQMNYLNKAPDTFNTAIVPPIYYVMFTTLTILASVIMFKVHSIIIKKTFSQVFSFINVRLFNSLLLRRECCSLSNGEYLKAGLQEPEQWRSKATNQYVGTKLDELQHIRQAVGFLVLHQKSQKSLNEIASELCPVRVIKF